MYPAVLPAAPQSGPRSFRRRKKAAQKASTSLSPTSMPSTSLWPLAVMPTATIKALEITCLRGGSRRCR